MEKAFQSHVRAVTKSVEGLAWRCRNGSALVSLKFIARGADFGRCKRSQPASPVVLTNSLADFDSLSKLPPPITPRGPPRWARASFFDS